MGSKKKPQIKLKDNPHNERKYLQMKQTVGNLSSKYTNSSCSSMSKNKQPNQKTGRSK